MTDHLPIKPVAGSMPAPRMLTQTSPEAARRAAETLEATFLAEMLKAAGFGKQVNTFSGGEGEDQFASFHRQAIADKIAAAGGIGLAEHFLRSMMEKTNE
ncbi:rod-binding protein [Roseovarius sp. B08]|uniref:rod-binding protein n=1 Tax=Roseovarius sp. B08 TaxID=3449223 RepID=UPI003EDBE3BC